MTLIKHIKQAIVDVRYVVMYYWLKHKILIKRLFSAILALGFIITFFELLHHFWYGEAGLMALFPWFDPVMEIYYYIRLEVWGANMETTNAMGAFIDYFNNVRIETAKNAKHLHEIVDLMKAAFGPGWENDPDIQAAIKAAEDADKLAKEAEETYEYYLKEAKRLCGSNWNKRQK